MTTEDDFQAALDAHPDDWQTRLVFADWLQERGDPRAEGYRALGVLKVRPYHGNLFGWTRTDNYHIVKPTSHGKRYAPCALPVPWYEALCGPDYKSAWWEHTALTRTEAEDAAAHAFAKLLPEVRSELLKPRELPRKRRRSK